MTFAEADSEADSALATAGTCKKAPADATCCRHNLSREPGTISCLLRRYRFRNTGVPAPTFAFEDGRYVSNAP